MKACLFLLLGIVMLAGISCNKTDKSDAEAVQTAQTLEYRSPTEEVVDRSTTLGRGGSGAAREAAKSGATEEQTALVRERIIADAPTYSFILSEDKSELVYKEDQAERLRLEEAVLVVTGLMLREGGFDEAPARDPADGQSGEKERADEMSSVDRHLTTYVSTYYTDAIALINARKMEKVRAERTDQTGKIIEPDVSGGVPKLDIAQSVAGEWMSLREVGVNSGTKITHSSSYHQYLHIKPDGNAQWIYFSRGSELSNDIYRWEYNKSTGELKLKHQNGTPYQTLKVFTSQTEPGHIFIETPGLDQIKVFGPATEGQ